MLADVVLDGAHNLQAGWGAAQQAKVLRQFGHKMRIQQASGMPAKRKAPVLQGMTVEAWMMVKDPP